ncbi:MAG: hypothetical protein ACFE8A_03230 [Candidatus Hodarchaeota archaeon]
MLKQIKGTLLGGHFSYYISKDRKYFVKICKGDLEWVIKEYKNLKKYWNILGIKNLQLVEPVNYSEEKEYIITKFVKGKRLVELLDPRIHHRFGQLLKEFHNKGFTHSHIELTDIIYRNGNFTLVDVPFFNEKSSIHDLATIEICFKTFRLKQPWKWYKYSKCYKEFLNGYQLKDFSELKKESDKSFNNRMNYMIKIGKRNKIKAYIMKFFHKIGLL